MTDKPDLGPGAFRSAVVQSATRIVLVFWALLSFGPLGGLMQGGGPFRIGVNIAFLLTGFYGMLAAIAFLKWLSGDPHRKLFGPDWQWSQPIAAYAAVWCVFYLIYLQMPR